MKLDRLVPCPFCGGKAEYVCLRVAEDAVASWVRCLSCGIRGPEIEDAYSDKQGAIAAWNKRHVPEGFAIVPVEPTEGLLASMAIRYDHGLGVPGYYDGPFFAEGTSHAEKLASAVATMRQLHEEVVGTGFHNNAKLDSEYAAMLSAAKGDE